MCEDAHWVVPRKRRDFPLPMFGSDPPSSEQKEPRVLSAVSVRGRGGLVFLCLDSSLFTVGFIAAITCSINTGTGYGGGTAGKLRCVHQDPCREMRKILQSPDPVFLNPRQFTISTTPQPPGVCPITRTNCGPTSTSIRIKGVCMTDTWQLMVMVMTAILRTHEPGFCCNVCYLQTPLIHSSPCLCRQQ